MTDPNRVRPAVPKSPPQKKKKTAIAAWQHVPIFPAASPHFYSSCDAPVSRSSGFQARARGMEKGGGGAEGCNDLRHHASFPSEGLCWLPSRWFTGPWRSRFVLRLETGLLGSASHHCQRKKDTEFISTSRFNLLSFIYLLGNADSSSRSFQTFSAWSKHISTETRYRPLQDLFSCSLHTESRLQLYLFFCDFF